MENLVNLFSFFENKKVLITGHTGFKGSWLIYWLTRLGANVMGYALPTEHENSLFNLLKLNERILHVEGDIRNYQNIKNKVDKFSPEIIFHLAAQSLVRRSYREPHYTMDTNILGSLNILELCRESESVKALVYITSDKCYLNREWDWGYRENDQLGGKDPYSASKVAAEIIFTGYQESFFKKKNKFGAATTRAGNVIGGGDWSEDRIIPDCVSALKNNKPIIIRNPVATRPWQHVLEPLSGYMQLAVKLFNEPEKYSGNWNFGPKPDAIKTVKQLAELSVEEWGSGTIEIDNDLDALHEAGLLFLNSDKAYQKLNWETRWDFNTAVKETIGWYLGIDRGEDPETISGKQIEKYMVAE